MMKLARKKAAKKVKVNNMLDMDNFERFKNVIIGYSIQAERILGAMIAQGTVTMEQNGQALKIMQKIKKNMLKLQSMKDNYDKHLTNNVYCKLAVKPYVDDLKMITAETDTFVKGLVTE